MSDIQNYAVTVGEIRRTTCGYKDEVLMVPYSLAVQHLKIYEEANRILCAENDKWAKELELVRTENDKLRKR